VTYTRKPLQCPSGNEVQTIKQLERRQYAAHDVGVAAPPLYERDPVVGYDEDAYRKADL
jgi:hypothetical protein